MGMFNFKSASGEAMKKDMEKKIERARQDVERLKTQHRQLMQEMRAPAAPKEEAPPAAAPLPEATPTAASSETPTSAGEAPPDPAPEAA